VTPQTEVLVKLAFTAAGLVLIVVRRDAIARSGKAGAALTLLAVMAPAVYFNFFTFHQGRFTHFGENFHYQLGSKYFPELGYDGLYEASVAAQAMSTPRLPLPRMIRDLRTNTIVPVRAVDEQREAVIRRFTPARWRSFVADHQAFLEPAYAHYLNELRLDHGYNPTPAWTFVGRLFNAWLPLDSTTIGLLALLDWVLLGAMFWIVLRTYGGAVGAVALVVFGAGYPWRYDWVGGGFLRYDWLFALVVGICLLKQRRFAASGALVAYAAAVRIFPALLVIGLVPAVARALVRRSTLAWAWRFAAGLGCGAAAMFLAGALAGRGFAAWPEFVRDIEKHHGTWSTNTAGLELVFVTTPSTMLSRLPESTPLPERWAAWQAEMNRTQAERRPLYLVTALVLVAGVCAAAWGRRRDEGVAVGVVAVFAGLVLSCYYWVALVTLSFRRGIGGAGAVLAANAAALATALATDDTQVIFLVFSWALLAALAVLLGWDVAAAARSGWAAAPEDDGREAAQPSAGGRRPARERTARQRASASGTRADAAAPTHGPLAADPLPSL